MYTKTQWVDNTTPINETNLNKIEKGIYDNSLITEAIADKLNPTDTETYKTAELTEGQITDVIGVNDIIIKGQTEQDGTPTPSAPVDVNVVSGSNVVSIDNENNKNLFDKNSNIVTPGYLSETGSVVTSDSTLSYQNKFIKVDPNTSYTISSNTNAIYRIAEYNSSKEFISRKYNAQVSKSYTITTSNNTHYIKMAGTLTTILNSLQIEQGSTATTYEPHQGKELPLDLGSIELCKIGDYQDYFYKSGSKWYLHKEIEKKVLDGSENWALSSLGAGRFYLEISPIFKMISVTAMGIKPYSSHFVGKDNSLDFENGKVVLMTTSYSETTSYFARFENDNTPTLSEWKTWLSNNNVTLYYVLATPTEEEITGTLKEQLEAIYNAPLYEQTNITQTNNDLPMILDITACKDNINGIKAFIRK